jgi:NAD(P)H-hydrate epimerase
MKVFTGQQMKEFDAQAMRDFAIPSLLLMENAGHSVCELLIQRIPDLFKKRVVIVAGKGNNGGDGLCVARHLLVRGLLKERLRAFLVGKPENLSEETETQAEILERFGLKIRYLTSEGDLTMLDEALSQADVVLDALLGIGVKGPVRGLLGPVIERINASQAFVVSVDLPSGVDADAGHVGSVAVRADLTITLEALKLGLLLYPGREYAGEITVARLGYPPPLCQAFETGLDLVDERFVQEKLPQRKAYSHKGTYGKALIVAGSRGLSGAAMMTVEAALRAGTGLVYLAYPESLSTIIESRLLEAVKFPLPESEGVLTESAAALVLQFVSEQEINVIAIGPGLSRQPTIPKLLEQLLPKLKIPVVIDADGINALASAEGRKLLKNVGEKSSIVLTPHPGELSRLIERDVPDIEGDRVGVAREVAQSFNVILVLKGVPTVTALPSGRVFINSTGNSGLATGGSGDVLTGLITGLIAQRMPPEEAAPAGVYLHGLLADRLKPKTGERAMLPRDLLSVMPDVLKELER